MATLQARLDAIKKAFAEKAPQDSKDIMQRATETLQQSGQAGRATQKGDAFPDFKLADQHGNNVALQELLARGPVVLSVFRGHW